MIPITAVLFGRRPPAVVLNTIGRIDWVVAALVSGLYLTYFLLIQPQVAVNNGAGWDGADYFRLAHGDYSSPVYPLVQRIGLPLLAGRWPSSDIMLNFKILNATLAWMHGVVTWILLAALIKPDRSWLRILAWMMICAIQVAPIPLAVWYPVQNDIAAAFFSQLLLLSLLSGYCQWYLLVLLFFLGTLCRENFAQYAVFFLFRWDIFWDRGVSTVKNITGLIAANWREALKLLCPSMAGYVAATLIVNNFVKKGMSIEDRFKFYIDGVCWHHLTDFALSMIGVLSSIWLYRFVLWVAGIKLRDAHILPVAPTRIIMLVFFIISLGGGTNTERYLYWILPFLVIQSVNVIDYLVRHQFMAAVVACLFYSVFMQRVFMPIHPIALEGCSPLNILMGDSAFMGHFGQQCESNGMSTILFFVLFVLPLLALLVLWLPKKAVNTVAMEPR
jgi:hypothetical protein